MTSPQSFLLAVASAVTWIQKYTNWVSSRRPTVNRRAPFIPVEPPLYSPATVLHRPSTVGVFTRAVALISSGGLACSGPTATIRDGALLRTGTSVMSQLRDQSDIAKTVSGLNTGPRNAADTDASICVPAEATFGSSETRSQFAVVAFHAKSDMERICPRRPVTSIMRFAVIPPIA